MEPGELPGKNIGECPIREIEGGSVGRKFKRSRVGVRWERMIFRRGPKPQAV